MTSAIVKPDAQTQQDVLTELSWDNRVEETDVGLRWRGVLSRSRAP